MSAPSSPLTMVLRKTPRPTKKYATEEVTMAPTRDHASKAPKPKKVNQPYPPSKPKATRAAFPSRDIVMTPAAEAASRAEAHDKKMKEWQRLDDGCADDWDDIDEATPISQVLLAYEYRAKRAYGKEEFGNWYRIEKQLIQDDLKRFRGTASEGLVRRRQAVLTSNWQDIGTEIFRETDQEAKRLVSAVELDMAPPSKSVVQKPIDSVVTTPNFDGPDSSEPTDKVSHSGALGYVEGAVESIESEDRGREPVSVLEQGRTWEGLNRRYGFEDSHLEIYARASWTFADGRLSLPSEDD